MKVKIFTEAGNSIGYGHLSRCVSLYKEIQKRKVQVELVLYGEAGDIFALNNKTITKKNWLDVEYLENTISNEDYVIVDSYIAQKKHYEIIASKSKKALYLDDTGRLEYPDGIIVHPSLNSHDIDYSFAGNNIVLTGPKYIILRSSFINSLNCLREQKIKPFVHKALVLLGGTDVRNLTSVIIDYIVRDNPNIIFEIVIKPEQYEKLSSAYKLDNINFHKNLSENKMNQIMLDSDLAITTAGQTIYELIATRTPFLAIQIADNQKQNIKALKDYISSKIVLSYSSKNFINDLEDLFLALKDYDKRKIIVGKLLGLLDGHGPQRIIDTMLNQTTINNPIYLRHAHIEDMKDVFELSNKGYVRQYSMFKEIISWEQHVEWFNKTLQDNKTAFYIVTNTNNSFLGQIRYNLEDYKARISISLSESIKGKGLAKTILKQSIEKLFAEKTKINEIIAFVLAENKTSLRTFKGLNFKYVAEKDGIIKLTLERGTYYHN